MEAMSERCPDLYDEYVGCFLTDAEISEETGSLRAGSWAAQLVSVLGQSARRECEGHSAGDERGMAAVDGAGAAVRPPVRKGAAAISMEGPDSGGHPNLLSLTALPTSETRLSGGPAPPLLPDDLDDDNSDDEPIRVVTLEEKEQLRRDFERLMRERFLSGGDAAFVDYSTIDDDDTLDNSKIAEQDAADAYFDAD